MNGPFNSGSDEEDVTFDEISSMADRLGLKGEARTNYIHDHMVQLGYDAVQSRDSYVRRQEEPDQGSTGRWGFGSGGRNQGRQGGRNRDNDDSF